MNSAWFWHRGLAAALAGSLGACTHTVKVEPIKVEPIDITLHIYLEADQKLDSFFGDTPSPASPAPVPPPADSTGGPS